GNQPHRSRDLIGRSFGQQTKDVQAGTVKPLSPPRSLQTVSSTGGRLRSVGQGDTASGNPPLQRAVFEIVLNDGPGLRDRRAVIERGNEVERQSERQAERNNAGPNGVISAPGFMRVK